MASATTNSKVNVVPIKKSSTRQRSMRLKSLINNVKLLSASRRRFNLRIQKEMFTWLRRDSRRFKKIRMKLEDMKR